MEKLIGQSLATSYSLILTSANFLTGIDSIGVFVCHLLYHLDLGMHQCCFLIYIHLMDGYLVSSLCFFQTNLWDIVDLILSFIAMASFFCCNFNLEVAFDFDPYFVALYFHWSTNRFGFLKLVIFHAPLLFANLPCINICCPVDKWIIVDPFYCLPYATHSQIIYLFIWCYSSTVKL